jgi:uncharacterized protein involved in exopolysaccharide biosynthesis
MESKHQGQKNLPATASSMPALPPFWAHGPSPGQKPQGLSLRDLLTVLFKHKVKIFITFLLAVVAAPIVYYYLPVVYEANSLLMIRSGREYASPQLNTEPTPLRVVLSDVVSTESSILTSRDLAERVIDALGLKNIYPKLEHMRLPQNINPLDVAVVYFSEDLTVESSKSSNIIKVAFQSKDPEMAARVVNQVVDSYKEKRLEILNDRMSAIMLEKKVAECKNRLNEVADKLESFKQKNQVFSFDEQRNLLLQQRMNLEISAMASKTEAKELAQRLSSLDSQLKAVPQNVLSSHEADRASEAELQLLTLQRKEQELLSKYKEDTVMVSSIRNEIRLVKDFIQNQNTRSGGKPTIVNDFYRDIQKEIMTTKAGLSATDVKATALSSQLGELDTKIQDLDRMEKAFRELKRELATAEEKYLIYAKKLEEAHISDDMDRQNMTSVNVIERATAPPIPIRPRQGLWFFVAVAAMMGIGGGVGLSFVLENSKQGLSSPERAEKCLGLPVLATINYQDRR